MGQRESDVSSIILRAAERKRESRRRVGRRNRSPRDTDKGSPVAGRDRCEIGNRNVVRECDTFDCIFASRRSFFFLGYSVRKCGPDVFAAGGRARGFTPGSREERNFATRRAWKGGGGGGEERRGRPHEHARGDAIN